MLLTFIFTHVLGNHVTAVMMTPIALNAALSIEADPRMFALAVALSAATGFLSPYAHPVNIMVMGPGNYRFSDFFKAGLPIALVMLVALFGMLAILFEVLN